MNQLLLLLLLLAAAYFGSLLAEGRAIRGFGLPSGAAWLVLGMLLGPHALRVFEGSTLLELEPLVIVGLGWTALVVGVDYGYVGERRIGWRGMGLGWLLSALCGMGVAASTWWYATTHLALRSTEAGITALAMALVSSETTRHAVRWISEARGADGPLARMLAEISDADDALPLLGLAVLMAYVAQPSLSVDFSIGWRLVVTLSLGVLIGLIAAGLLAQSLAFGESWLVIIGSALLGIGTSMRLGASALTVMFVVGVVISRSSHRHTELRKMLAPTERPVTLPLLLLAGATLEPTHTSWPVLGLVGIVIGARLAMKLVSGWIVAAFVPAARKSPSATGGALCASGTLAMSIGLYTYLNLKSPLGAELLLVAALATVLGELLGPAALRRALQKAGEVGPQRIRARTMTEGEEA